MYTISQNDDNPVLRATLSAEYDADYPDQIIYNAGDTINFYVLQGTWQSRQCSIDDVIDEGRSVRVSVNLSDFASVPGTYQYYFRNETTKLSFPSDDPLKMRVTAKGGNE